MALVRRRVVTKKIVSWPRFSLSQSSFFERDLEQNFAPNLLQQLTVNERLPSHVYKMADAVHGKGTQDFIPVTCTLLIIVALILKVVRNLFSTFHLQVDSSLWVRYQIIV